MPQVTVRSTVPLSWIGDGEEKRVELTPLVEGAIRGGHLHVVAEHPDDEED